MALPSSGQLSISQINTELGRASNASNSSLRDLAALAKVGSTPYNNRNGQTQISDWYGYTHSSQTPGSALAYSIVSGSPPMPVIDSISTIFSTARTVAGGAQGKNDGTPNEYYLSCHFITGSNLYEISRFIASFNSTPITSATSVNLSCLVTTNTLKSNTSFVIVQTTSIRPYTYNWGMADFNEGNGGVIVSNIITITVGQTGTITFVLNSTGISYVNANTSSNFVMLQYSNDYLNTTSGILSGNSTEQKIYCTNTSLNYI